MIEAGRENEGTSKEGCRMKPIVDYLENSKLSENKNDARKLRLKAAIYALIAGTLFKKSLFGPLLHCVSKDESQTILWAIHYGVCGNHFVL